MRPRKTAPDVRLFLWLIPAINVLNYYLTYTKISVSWFTLITFTIDTLEGYAAWLMLRAIIRWLDRFLSYEREPVKRILVQVGLTSAAGLFVIITLTELVNFLATDKPVPTVFYQKDVFIFLIWFFVVNGIYAGRHYYALWRSAEKSGLNEQRLRIEQQKALVDTISVRVGKQDLQLPFREIAAFFVSESYPFVLTTEGRQYVTEQSLDKLEQDLPAAAFFRVNRQLILHRRQIAGFRRIEDGKLLIALTQPGSINCSLQVSRIKAPAFKLWLAAKEPA